MQNYGGGGPGGGCGKKLGLGNKRKIRKKKENGERKRENLHQKRVKDLKISFFLGYKLNAQYIPLPYVRV